MKTIHENFSIKPINTPPIEESNDYGFKTALGETIGWLMQSCDVFREGPFVYEDDNVIITLSDPIFDMEKVELCKYIAREDGLFDPDLFHYRFFKTRTVTAK